MKDYNKAVEFDKYIEERIKQAIQYEKDECENNSYSYLVEEKRNDIKMKDITLSDDIQDLLTKKGLTKDDIILHAITYRMFSMSYEELASPFQYGGAQENEVEVLNIGGGEIQIDLDDVKEYLLDLNDYDSYESFDSFMRENVQYTSYLQTYYNFCKGQSSQFIPLDNHYDIVRVILNEDEVLEYLKSQPNKKVNKRKTLTITEDEFNDLNNSYSGFCVSCGKINEGGHEPDAVNYECGHCEEPASSGIEQLMLMGYINITDDEDESTLDDAY